MAKSEYKSLLPGADDIDYWDTGEDEFCPRCGLRECLKKPCKCSKCKQPERACKCQEEKKA